VIATVSVQFHLSPHPDDFLFTKMDGFFEPSFYLLSSSFASSTGVNSPSRTIDYALGIGLTSFNELVQTRVVLFDAWVLARLSLGFTRIFIGAFSFFQAPR